MVEKKLLICVAALTTIGSVKCWSGETLRLGKGAGALALKNQQGVSNLDDPMLLGKYYGT